jgi:hypothetical protein
MADEDEEARKARAARLRAEIERLKAGQQPAEPPDQPSAPESPRAYVERRMREIDEDQQEEPSLPEAGSGHVRGRRAPICAGGRGWPASGPDTGAPRACALPG